MTLRPIRQAQGKQAQGKMVKSRQPKSLVLEGATAWYLKYRPKTISELDQEAVRESLLAFIKNRHIPHALLFAGPKGTGKTSAARIVAKILNCTSVNSGRASSEPPVVSPVEPCNKCPSCLSITNGSSLSVLELDGASNRGIEDIRQIREAVNLSVADRFRIYIIDEAHMLTAEAANALLKTLEEPPPHVVFILATTSPEKIPETVRSRTTVVTFRRATRDEIVSALERVAAGEKLKIAKKDLENIFKICGGSFRDAIKMLEQTSLGLSVKGGKPLVDTLLLSVAKKDVRNALFEIENVEASGENMRTYTTELLSRLHELMLLRLGVEVDAEDLEGIGGIEDIKQLLKLFTDAASQLYVSPIPSLPLELAVVEWCRGDLEVSQAIRSSHRESGEMRSLTGSPVSRESGGRSRLRPSISSLSIKDEELKEKWEEILQSLKPKNHTIAALLRSAKPEGVDGDKCTITVFYQFHKDRLVEEKNRLIVEQTLGEILGHNVIVDFTLGKKPKEVESQERQVTSEEIADKGVNDQKPVNVKEQGQGDMKDEDLERAAEEIFGGKIQN